MDNARLQHIFTIVDTALSLEPVKRTGYLTEVCGEDKTLREEVVKLLKSIDSSEGFWEGWQNWNKLQIQDLLQGSAQKTGEFEQIGSWRLVKLLGRGGMGTVFLAERADGQYKQQAAVKLLQRGLEAGESARRFGQERQILARLDHPNIAGLYDGGITEDGRPWLAMQYVDGIPITNWCKKHDCSLRQRLELFQKVCEAVRYAHKNLIVHRDLKPENILVTENGTVKVLDFGIAKLLDQELSREQRIHTQTGLRVMSLDYAAPEQITGDLITTATDVYALGILLYELLTGKYPFSLEGLNQRKAEQVLRNEDPPKPSSAAVNGQNRLRGDLDAITLKALRKEPEQRYENAGQLLDDLEWHRANRPVSARRDTFRYRTGKFYKRHRGKLVAGAVILLAVISLVAFYTYRITKERNAAEIEARRAKAVTDFLISIFDYSNPTAKHSDDITAREILDQSTASISDKLKDQPGIQAKLYDATGQIYHNLGLLDKAKPLFSEALRIAKERVKQGQADRIQLAFIYHNYGTLYRDLGMYDSSSAYIRKAVELYKTAKQEDYLATSLSSLGWVELLKGNYDRADSILQQTLKIRKELNGTTSVEYADVLQRAGWLEYYKGNFEKADSLFRNVLPIRKKYQGEEHRDVATLLHSLGWIAYSLGNYEDAIQLNEEALKIRKKIFGEKHSEIAWTMNNLGVIKLAVGDYVESERLFKESLAMRRELLGDEHPDVAQTLGNLGRLYYIRKDYKQAETIYRQVLAVDKKRLGDSHPGLITDLNNLSVVLDHEGRKEEALEMASKALQLAKSIFEPAHPTFLALMGNKAKTLERLHRYKEAEELRKTCFEAAQKAKGLQNEQTRKALEDLIALYKAWNKPEKISFYTALRADSTRPN